MWLDWPIPDEVLLWTLAVMGAFDVVMILFMVIRFAVARK